MVRDTIHYGFKVALFCQGRNGHVLATTSALMPLGILPDDPTRDPPPFERAVFLIAPAEGDYRKHRQHSEEIKFGQVIRLVHESSDRVVTCSDVRHAIVDKAHQRVTLERPTGDIGGDDDGFGGGGGGGPSGGKNAGSSSSPNLQKGSGGGGGGSSSKNVQKFDRWRVLPRFRVQAEGERVRDQDHVILQAASGENFFLHVSKSRDSDGYHELNCGPISEGFGIMIYDKDPPTHGQHHSSDGAGAAGPSSSTAEEKEIRGGSCIMLFHKEEKGYVFADTFNKTCVLDPYDDPSPGRITRAHFSAPLNSKMMFVVEFEERHRGGIVTSGRKQLFRLKALFNNMYLCVRSKGEKVVEKGSAKDGASEMGGSVYASSSGLSQALPTVTISEHAVSLTSDVTNAGTLFAFHQAADDQGGSLHNRSRIFLEAPEIDTNGVWFSVGGRVTTRMNTENASSAGMRKSARPKKKLVFQDIQNMKDGIEVQRVPRSAYAALINVLALLPPLEAFAAQAGEADEIPNFHLLTQAIENLAALRSFCFVGDDTFGSIEDQKQLSTDEILKGTVDREGQRRLLDQGVVSIALQIAKNVSSNKNVNLDLLGSTETVGGDGLDTSKTSAKNDALITVKYADIQEVLSLSFGLVQDIVRSAPYNALSIPTDTFDFIVDSTKKIPAALDCLLECVRNNPALVDTGDDLKTLKFVVEWLMESGRDERILDLLTCLVECDGLRLTTAQNYVCETLLKRRDIAAGLFAPFTSQGGAQVGVASWYCNPPRGGGGGGGGNPLSGTPSLQVSAMEAGKGGGNPTFARSSNSRASFQSSHNPLASTAGSSLGGGMGGASTSVAGPRFCPTAQDVSAGGSQMIHLNKLNEFIVGLNSSNAQQRMDRFIRYVSRQLLLFAGLCAGHNSTAIAIVHQLVPVEIILPMMMSDVLHVSLRAAFVKLFNNSVVDVEGAIDLTEHVRSIRHVIDDPVNADAYCVEHDISEMLGNAKKFIFSYLRNSQGRLDVGQPEGIHVMDAVLRTLTALLQRGMFLLAEYTELVWLLCTVLDARNDALPKFMSDKAVTGGGQEASAILDLRFRVTEEVRPLIATKLRVFRCLFIIVELILTQHVATVVNGFVRGRSIGHVTQLVDVDPASKISAFSFGVFNRRKTLSDAARSITNERERLIAVDKAERDLVHSPLGGLLEDGPLLPILSHLVGVVMNVAQYQDVRMRTAAIELYCVLTNFPGEILKKCRRVQLLTSHASAGYYNNIKAIAMELERSSGVSILNDGGGGSSGRFGSAAVNAMLGGPAVGTAASSASRGGKINAPTLTMDRMQIAAACLERLEFLSAQKEGGAMIEKIAMMRHVGIPKIITVLLSAIPTPPREEYRRFVFNCVALLKTLAEDELICEMLCESCNEFTHLTSHDMDILGLLRVLYINRTSVVEYPITPETIKQIVSCITFSHSAVPAVLLLQDLLQKVDSKGKYITRNQVLVWRALLNDSGVLKIIKLRRQWTGKRGRPMRDSLLSGREYFNPAGNLRLHLEIVKLLFLIAKYNDSVRAEEMRFEVFGVNAIEDLMEVVTNVRLPAFYRNAYLMLLQVTIIDDREGFQSLINHRKLPDLIEMCQNDVETLASLCSAFEATVAAQYQQQYYYQQQQQLNQTHGSYSGAGGMFGGAEMMSGGGTPMRGGNPFENPLFGNNNNSTINNNDPNYSFGGGIRRRGSNMNMGGGGGGGGNGSFYSGAAGGVGLSTPFNRINSHLSEGQASDSASGAGGNPYAQAMASTLPFATDSRVKVCVAENELEQAVEERRNGLAFFADHVTLAVLPALKLLVTRVLLERSSRVSVYMKGAIITTINELIDSVCELARLVFVTSARPFTDYPGFGDNIDCREQLKAFLLESVRLDCKGTDEWSDDVNLLALIIPTDRDKELNNNGVDDEEFAGAKDEKALTSRWLDYLHSQLEINCAAVRPENGFATAAGIILRSGPAGAKFAATLVKGIDEVNEDYQLACFNIIRQVCALGPLHAHDDSVMMSFDPAVLIVTGAVAGAGPAAHGGSVGSSGSGVGGSGSGGASGGSTSALETAVVRREIIATVGTGSSSVNVRLLGIGALTAVALDSGPIVLSSAAITIGDGAMGDLTTIGKGKDTANILIQGATPAKGVDKLSPNMGGVGGGGIGTTGAIQLADQYSSNSKMSSISPSNAAVILRITAAVANATECVTLSQELKNRQDIMSRWGKGYNDQVLPTVIALFSTEDYQILQAGTACANTLLEGGNKRMQEIFRNWVQERNDEEIFLVLRNRLSACRDSLRYYAHLRKRDVDPGSTLDLLPMYRRLLRFIQLLCEGHNEDLQKYLRSQPDNQISVNVLECLEGVLEVAARCVDAQTVEFTQQLLSTISETIQGPCKSNQDMFVSSGIADHLVKILSLPTDIRGCDPQDVQRARLLAMTTLLSLLEGRSEVSFVAMAIASLDLRLLGKAMDRSLAEFEAAHGSLEDDDADKSALRQWLSRRLFGSDDSDEGDKAISDGNKKSTAAAGAKRTEITYVGEMSDELNVGTSVFILFKSCLDLEHLYGIELKDRQGSTLKQILRHTPSFKEINKRVAMIELIRGGVLERAYFRIPSLCKENLKKESKKLLIKQVSRESDNDRLQDYFERCMKLISEVEYYGYLREIPVIHMIHDNISVVETIAIVFAFIANILMLATFKIPNSVYETAIPEAAEIALTTIGAICAASQALLLLHFCMGAATVVLNDFWTQQLDDLNQEAVQEARENLSIDPPQIIRDIKAVVPFPNRVFLSARHLLVSSLCWRRVIFCACAFAGVFHTPIWFSVLILQIAVKNELLTNCVYAITKNGASLLLTCFLLLCVAYVFAAVAYLNFPSYFDPFGDGGVGIHCRSLAHCTLIHIINGVMSQGMHEISMPAGPQPHFAEGYFKLFYDFIYFVVIVVLFMNIVMGIIIDTFAELREQRDFVVNDQEQKCFICGIQQNNFDRIAPGSFEHHVQFEHNMWHYLYFFHYIKLKSFEDLNGQEQHVHNKVTIKDLSFFPIGKAMMLDHSEGGGGFGGGDGGGGLFGLGGGIGGASSQEERLMGLISQIVKKELSSLDEKLERVAERLGMSGEELEGYLEGGNNGNNPLETGSRRSAGNASAKGGGGGGGGGTLQHSTSASSFAPLMSASSPAAAAADTASQQRGGGATAGGGGGVQVPGAGLLASMSLTNAASMNPPTPLLGDPNKSNSAAAAKNDAASLRGGGGTAAAATATPPPAPKAPASQHNDPLGGTAGFPVPLERQRSASFSSKNGAGGGGAVGTPTSPPDAARLGASSPNTLGGVLKSEQRTPKPSGGGVSFALPTKDGADK